VVRGRHDAEKALTEERSHGWRSDEAAQQERSRKRSDERLRGVKSPSNTLSRKSSTLNRDGCRCLPLLEATVLSASRILLSISTATSEFPREGLGVFAPLADALLSVGVPGAALSDDVLIERHIEDRSHLRDAVTVGDVELGLPERWSAFILDDFDARARSDAVLADFDRFELANVEPNGRIEFQRAAARRRSGFPNMMPTFSRSWLMKIITSCCERSRRQLAQRLGHQSGLHPTCASPISPSSSARVTSAATESTTTTSTALLRVSISRSRAPALRCRLRDQQVCRGRLERRGVVGIERVLDVDEGGRSAGLLRLGDGMQGQRRLAARLGAIDLTIPRGEPSHAER